MCIETMINPNKCVKNGKSREAGLDPRKGTMATWRRDTVRALPSAIEGSVHSAHMASRVDRAKILELKKVGKLSQEQLDDLTRVQEMEEMAVLDQGVTRTLAVALERATKKEKRAAVLIAKKEVPGMDEFDFRSPSSASQ
jgi:hypothetical protein